MRRTQQKSKNLFFPHVSQYPKKPLNVVSHQYTDSTLASCAYEYTSWSLFPMSASRSFQGILKSAPKPAGICVSLPRWETPKWNPYQQPDPPKHAHLDVEPQQQQLQSEALPDHWAPGVAEASCPADKPHFSRLRPQFHSIVRQPELGDHQWGSAWSLTTKTDSKSTLFFSSAHSLNCLWRPVQDSLQHGFLNKYAPMCTEADTVWYCADIDS